MKMVKKRRIAPKAKAAATAANNTKAKTGTRDAKLKTILTSASVDAFIDTLDEARRADAHTLVDLFTRASGWPAKMWGPAIVGFGKYQYTYESGRSGEMCALGFSPRKANFAIYVADFPEKAALLAKLGKHKGGVEQCLYINRVADVDQAVLGKILAGGLAQLKKKWPVSAA